MDDRSTVQEIDSAQNLFNYGGRRVFGEANVVNVRFEKSSTWEEFLNEIEFLFILENIDDSADAWMI